MLLKEVRLLGRFGGGAGRQRAKKKNLASLEEVKCAHTPAWGTAAVAVLVPGSSVIYTLIPMP